MDFLLKIIDLTDIKITGNNFINIILKKKSLEKLVVNLAYNELSEGKILGITENGCLRALEF